MMRKAAFKRGIALILILTVFTILLCGCGKDSAPVSKKSRTIFIYMCGSNLETKNGAAGKNIDELLAADIGDDLNIVIETGGAAEWKSHGIKSDVLSRYEVRDGKLKLIETRKNASMGEAKTLSDFLSWGRKRYQSEHNVLILWDHGSGPVNGVCFDENYRFDPLTLTELKSALDDAGLDRKYDLIGFDACLMANIETASVVSEHADYMVASEEIEPPGGWDYKALAEAFASGTDGLELGKVICDSYMEKSRSAGKDHYATLSVFDLSVMPEMLEWFDKAMLIIEDMLGDKKYSGEMIRALRSCDRFGGNNSYQGRSNLIDLIDIFNQTPSIPGDLTGLWEIVGSFAPYNVCGSAHFTHGVSFYYPVLYDLNEIKEYIDLGIIEGYNSFLNDYYLNTPDKTVEITDTGRRLDDGGFGISMTPDSLSYLASIDYLLMTTDENGEQHVVFTDNNIDSDPDRENYESSLDGLLPALDGHRMFSAATLRNEFFVSYSAPVIVNGERTTFMYDYSLPSEYDEEGYFIPMGLWSGYDENGLPDSEITQLKKGDKVQVLTDVTYRNGDVVENWSEEFTVSEDYGTVEWVPFDEKEYQYVFVAQDVFGNTFTSDMATLKISSGGTGSGEGFSYEVTDIQPYTLGYIPDN